MEMFNIPKQKGLLQIIIYIQILSLHCETEKVKIPESFSFLTFAFTFKWKLCIVIPGKTTFLKHFVSSAQMHRQCPEQKIILFLKGLYVRFLVECLKFINRFNRILRGYEFYLPMCCQTCRIQSMYLHRYSECSLKFARGCSFFFT